MAEMKIWFDEEGDTLEVTFEDAPATLEEVSDDIFERRTPDGRVIGVAVFNVSKYDKPDMLFPLRVIAEPAA